MAVSGQTGLALAGALGGGPAKEVCDRLGGANPDSQTITGTLDVTGATTLTSLTATGAVAMTGSIAVEGVLIPSTCTVTPAAGGANISNVTIQFKDGAGTNIAYPVFFQWFLSDAATGLGITGTAASGTVQVVTSGSDLEVVTAKKFTRCQTDAAGKYIIEVTDAAKTQFYVVVWWGLGPIVISRILTANYG